MIDIGGGVDPAGGQDVEVTGVGPAFRDERAVVGSDVSLIGQYGQGAGATGSRIDAGIVDGDNDGGLLVLRVGRGVADGGQEAEDEGGNQRHHLDG